MSNPIDDLDTLLTTLADQGPSGVSRAAVELRVASRRRRRTTARVGGAILVAAALVGGVVAVEARSNPTRQTTVGSTSTALGIASTIAAPTTTPVSFPPAGSKAQNFLVVGADSNACVDPNSPWAGAADPARDGLGTRSDTIMIVRLDPGNHHAAVLSLPRDLWVRIPGRGNGRINTAYVKNDYSLLAQTLYDNFGIAVDHYLQIDFCAFTRIVDAVGGVAVPFSTPVLDANVGIDITSAGCHTFTGAEALAYVRSRHLKWIDSNGGVHEDRAADFGRIARQQDLFVRVFRKVLTAGLLDPQVAQALIQSLQNDIVTEAGFTLHDMMAFAGVLKSLDPGAIARYQVAASSAAIAGNFVLLPQLASPDMRAVLAIFRGTAATADSTTPDTAGDDTGVPTLTGKADIVPDPNVVC